VAQSAWGTEPFLLPFIIEELTTTSGHEPFSSSINTEISVALPIAASAHNTHSSLPPTHPSCVARSFTFGHACGLAAPDFPSATRASLFSFFFFTSRGRNDVKASLRLTHTLTRAEPAFLTGTSSCSSEAVEQSHHHHPIPVVLAQRLSRSMAADDS
jgi:hypothetical protein